ncbi:MAG: MBL fold metallo-hydrolase, partial [Rhodospirillales bacterium]|nr:MBL fold metallo-hydrolase [Rhodospirillales bacterium]
MVRKFLCAVFCATALAGLTSCDGTSRDTPAPRIEITWLGGPTMILEFNGFRILTDPAFGDGDKAFTMGDPNEMFDLGTGPTTKFHKRLTPFPELDPNSVDLVVLSHAHEDHFDQTAQAALAPTIAMILPVADTGKVAALGYENLDGLGWGAARTFKVGSG